MNNDWMVLTTINAPRHVVVTGDDLDAWLRGNPSPGASPSQGASLAAGASEPDTMGLQAFFYECDLGAQLGFLRGRHIPVEQALAVLDQYVRPGFPTGFHFPLDAWAA
ncbi:MAG: hypothetical protein PHG39_02400 [Acidithiobacillus ferrooxidans]|nr:hypothetical protein [Acidithiobacillus ferrooxidans]MDD5002834.1 hypothetical protein [Acidithiobacillus sp.]MDD5379535.1 hypothetical protein [Acidithiobacillus sp.]MDD5576187.1 hypothetical protein [Acidithiobacillus sp.]